MSDWYILDDDNNTILEPDMIKASKWLKDNRDRKRVCYTEFTDGEINYRLSTVFLGLDHSFTEGYPLIFETMLFQEDGWNEAACYLYSTYDEALQGHNDLIAAAKEKKNITILSIKDE